MTGMTKHQDAELEKGREDVDVEDVGVLFDDHRMPLFDDDDDAFEEHVLEDTDFDYEPDDARFD